MEKAITFDKVSKTYFTSKGKYGLLRDTLDEILFTLFKKNYHRKPTVIALKNVSFDVKRGEVVGIIGRNGAGKSTILKLISKITFPNAGQIVVNGRIGAFIELGAGLHHELSGRENIYLYGTILGMRRREIERKFNDIVDFAEIKKFLDIPIKKYSSGMYSRLGFSVCAFCDPDILLVDEVLAVGDLNFQKKCLAKMKSFAKEKTIVFVSHNMEAIKKICNRVIYMENGRIIKIGEPQRVIDYYIKRSEENFN